MSEDRWVPLTQEPMSWAQAQVLKGLLEAQGVWVHLVGEGLGQALGLPWGPLGGVEVLVPASQQALARRIYQAFLAGGWEEQAGEGGPPEEPPG